MKRSLPSVAVGALSSSFVVGAAFLTGPQEQQPQPQQQRDLLHHLLEATDEGRSTLTISSPSSSSLPSMRMSERRSGRLLFQSCQSCHVGPPLGPPLWSNQACLLGVSAGTAFGSDYPYSSALRDSGIVWNENTLDAFLKDPQALIPGTVMGNEPMDDPMERQMMIGILKSFCSDTLGPGGGDSEFVDESSTQVPTDDPDEDKAATGAAAGGPGRLTGLSSSLWMMAPVVVTSWLFLGAVGGAGRRY